MLGEWERGLRNRVTTEMLHLAAMCKSTPLVAWFARRPGSDSVADSVFRIAVPADLAAERCLSPRRYCSAPG